MDKIWMPVFGFDGYEITSDGEVRSFRFGRLQRPVRPRNEPTGYVRYGLMRDGRQVWRFAHRLVWESFNGPIAEGLVVNHIDGDKRNNSLSNLEAVSHSENVKHSFRVLGAKPNIVRKPGESNAWAKLTNETVSAIRKMRSETGLPYHRIGAAFGINTSTAHRICAGKAWRHI